MNILADMIRADRRAILQIAGVAVVYVVWIAVLFYVPALIVGR